MRFGSLFAALSAVVVAIGALSSCSYRNETINRVVDPYWRKSDFDPNTQWYYRTTVVDAPPNAGWISIADGDWLMLDRIRWEITEGWLIGWQDYPTVPGTELDQVPGAEDVFKGEPVAVFGIRDHFDIRNDFDPSTGEVGNQIVENRDRQWFDRAFMRVDWSKNQVATWKWHIMLNQVFNTATVQPNEVGDPERWRFETDGTGKLDYFEVTTRTTVEPDIYALYGFYGPEWSCFGGVCDISAQVISMRHSFMRVPPSDYEPLPMPGTVVLEDENGEEVRDERGFAVRVPVNDRFGFFGTLGRNTFDENRGMVTSGQIFNAARFNIWKTWRNADGSPIPVEQREPKAIVYYTNVDHPASLLPGSRRVEREWNRVFRAAVAAAQPSRYTGALDENGIPADVPPMFELRENDCNIARVEEVLNGLPSELRAEIETAAQRQSFNPDVLPFNGTIADVRTRFARANDPANTAPFTQRQAEETQALNDLERICSALEYYTAEDVTQGRPAPTLEDGTPITPFKYQRLGDNRYSLMNVIPAMFQSGWSGLGPPFGDPITGETISATANVAMHHIDRSAARAAQFVAVLNGELAPSDVAYGFDIERYMNQKLLQSVGLTSRRPENRAKERMHGFFDALKAQSNGDVMRDAVGEAQPGRARALMDRLAGTEIEQNLITADDLIAFGHFDPLEAEGASLDEQVMNAVSPLRDNNMVFKLKDHQHRIIKMGLRAMDPPEMVDNLVLGQAIAYRNMPYEERYQKLREDIYVAVMLHEVGHNVGLFHNMAGSSDALNYGQQFWDIQALPTDLDDAIDALAAIGDDRSQARIAQIENCQAMLAQAVDNPLIDPRVQNLSAQECLRQTEVMYSSIMDYHANWNSDFGGLGPYDAAAVKFGYTQLLEVFPQDALAPELRNEIQGMDAFQAEQHFRRQMFLDDWRDIVNDKLAGTAAVSQREHVKLDWNTSSMRIPDLGGRLIAPYKFGWGGQLTPDEKPFDFGADFQQNAQWLLTRYYERYFFSHFARNRLLDYFDLVPNALYADLGVLDDFTEKMQWFFFFEATDPEFRGTYKEADMLQSTITGLNLFGQVLAHPANGRYVSVRKQDIFGLLDEPPENRDASPSDIAIEWSALGECTARQVAVTDAQGDGIFVEPATGHFSTIVPASEGRPFFLGLTDDYEEWYATYVGTYWTKLYAMQYLGWNYAYLPRVDGNADWRVFDISWYRLFPKEVSRLLYAMMVDGKSVDIGARIDAEGNYLPFELVDQNLDEVVYTNPDGSEMTKILPSLAFNHQFYAPIWANVFMQSGTDDTLDLPKTMTIALEGGNDDTSAFDEAVNRVLNDNDPTTNPDDVVATFTHPVTGLTLRGLKVGEYPVAYDMINRLNRLKERFELLDSCVVDFQNGVPGDQLHPYCHCINAYTDLINGDCIDESVEAPGEQGCSEYNLRNRRDSAREIMDDLVDFVGDLRTINKYLGQF